MSELLLKNLLNGTLNAELVIKWLKNEEIEGKSSKLIGGYECSQAEFILFFLNYLHEETSGILQSFSSQVTPNRIRTPRRIESFSSKTTNQNEFKKTNTRRTALFPDRNKSQSDQVLGVSSLESDSKNNCSVSQMTSTPTRSNKSRQSFDKSLPVDLDANSFCPISPIYKNKNGFSKSITPRSSRLDTSNLCLGDFIVQKKNSSKKKHPKQLNSTRETDESFNQTNDKPNIENCLNHSNIEASFDSSNELSRKHSSDERINKNTSLKINRRRINPTNISQDCSAFNSKRITSNDTRNSFSFQKVSETEVSAENMRERDILREERLKILSRPKISESDNISQLLVTPRQVRPQNVSAIKPCLDSVTFKPQLDILAQIYSLLFDLNLVLNVLSELYFLITLVLLQVNNNFDKFNTQTDKKIEELRTTLWKSLTDIKENNTESYENIFKSVHNCVYFAATVLNKQCYILSALDRASLKLLEENSRLRTFAPDLTKELVVYHGRKAEKKNDSYAFSGGENVSFISDTDNRENFPSDSCFHTFRKQRDLFYEILQIWDTNHLQSGWNFSSTLGIKIRSLIFMHSDPINSMHLARLFKNQLLAETSFNSDTAPLPSCLNGLTNVDAGKLNRLRDRLVSKKSTGGPSPEPTFPGRQDFYKEFILASCSPGFHRHLIDCLVADILQLDDIFVSSSNVDETDAVIDEGKKILYLNSLKSLKVLGKFLGFLDSLPYKSDFLPNHQILTSQVALRKHFLPSIDIVNRVTLALHTSKLSLTIPWVADYLAMMDHISLRLPYFSSLIDTLFEIHYSCAKKFVTSKLEKVLMVKLCLGWLFERPNFPLDTYQQWISKKYQQNSTETIIVKNNILAMINNDNFYVDKLDLVDESVLFICCPYLYEIRNFLSSDSSNCNFNKSGPAKYIRPISTVSDNSDISNKRIQKQLEDAFFHNQPSSTKKTIDLVSERVASACAKHVCNNLVPSAKLKSLEKFQQHLVHVSAIKDLTKLQEQLALCCMKKAKDLSDQCFEEFKNSSKDEIRQCTTVRCENSLKALLADDVHPIARTTCISIAIQQSIERIEQWFSSHVNPGIFLKDFVSEMENHKQSASQNNKKITYKLPARGKNIEHDPDVKSPVKLLTHIREIMFQIHDKPEDVMLENLEQMFADSILTCQRRCDLNPVAQFTICRMFFDMFFMLATNRPDLAIEPSFLDTVISFWETYIHKSEKDNFFDRIFCPRNACMFERSQQLDKTWKACELLIIKLMRKKLLKTDNFEKQTIAMFRYEWQNNMTQNYSKCVQNIVDDYVKTYGSQENFTYILRWIADYCNDDEFF